MRSDPIRSILAAQDPGGWWVKPGAGYAPKYTGTVWQVIFLDQFGADGSDPRVRAACSYVLDHTQTSSGGFGESGAKIDRPPPPSHAIHCLNGNLLRALIGPMGYGNTKPNGSWFKPGWPSGYVADVLQDLEVLTELGFAKDPRLGNAIEWLLSKRGEDGRWRNEHAYNGKTWTDVEPQGRPSRWVTLRASRVLRRALA